LNYTLRNIQKLFWESCVIVDHEHMEKRGEGERERERYGQTDRQAETERQRIVDRDGV